MYPTLWPITKATELSVIECADTKVLYMKKSVSGFGVVLFSSMFTFPHRIK